MRLVGIAGTLVLGSVAVIAPAAAGRPAAGPRLAVVTSSVASDSRAHDEEPAEDVAQNEGALVALDGRAVVGQTLRCEAERLFYALPFEPSGAFPHLYRFYSGLELLKESPGPLLKLEPEHGGAALRCSVVFLREDRSIATEWSSEPRVVRKLVLPRIGMVVFGDSVARGIFSDTRMGQLPPRPFMNKLAFDYLSAGAGMTAMSVGEFDQRYANESRTAFVGDMSWSHWQRLRARAPGFTAKSFAAAGAGIRGLSRQLKAAEDRYRKVAVGHRPDYVVIEIGTNDFCTAMTPRRFASYYEAMLRRAGRLFPKATFLLVPLFHVPRLFEVAPPSALAFVYPFFFTNRPLTCRETRDSFPMCARPEPRSPEARADLEAMNRNVDMVARKLTEEGVLRKVVVARSVASPGFIDARFLAGDCFHPNIDGHRVLAEQTWQALISQ